MPLAPARRAKMDSESNDNNDKIALVVKRRE